jgi:hypothetical protein
MFTAGEAYFFDKLTAGLIATIPAPPSHIIGTPSELVLQHGRHWRGQCTQFLAAGGAPCGAHFPRLSEVASVGVSRLRTRSVP